MQAFIFGVVFRIRNVNLEYWDTRGGGLAKYERMGGFPGVMESFAGPKKGGNNTTDRTGQHLAL